MTLTRRQFLIGSGLVAGGAALDARLLYAGPATAAGAAAYDDWGWVRNQFVLSDDYLHLDRKSVV